MLSKGPDVVLVMFGTNDAVMIDVDWPQVDRDTFAANVQTIVDKIRAIGATPVLMTVIPLIEGNGADGYYYSRHPALYYWNAGGARAFHDSYNDIVRTLAASNGLTLVDHWAAFMQAAGGTDDAHLIASGLIDASGTHMTEKGAQLVAEQLASL